MDATENEQDVKLQRASKVLIDDLKVSLRPLLWKTSRSGQSKIRSRVISKDLSRISNMIDMFQELPQLLDPHLSTFISILADSFLSSLQNPPTLAAQSTKDSLLLVPVYKASCQLLYRFCKVRGDKVIIRFLSTEIRYIELLLSAFENGIQRLDAQDTTGNIGQVHNSKPCWEWEEIYITMLWLSQLLLAPFDLASISSETSEIKITEVTKFVWPSESPGVTLRIIPLAARFLSSPGKEKDAAKGLLVRLAMRKDMQEIGILESVVRWAIIQLRPSSAAGIHFSLGILSLIAGLLTSSVGTTDMDPYLMPIFQMTQDICESDAPTYRTINNSAIARKTMIKIMRSLVVVSLKQPESMLCTDFIEGTISFLLNTLKDVATPVRFAASKALSIISMKLPSDMALEVLEEVLSLFKKNVYWVSLRNIRRPDLSRVDPLEWHGLTLTLANLIYHHSIPAQSLATTLDSLRIALSFEKRSPSGSAIGTNVRDAACFGLWSLARRYSTTELKKVTLRTDEDTTRTIISSLSTLQILASDLVVSATLDPAGNIRRGSSAALQELIGRHPDNVDLGIEVVQVVNYHAIALRSRAIQDVAFQASALSPHYHLAILQGLLGWRGVRHSDAASRRSAALTTSKLIWANKTRSKNLDPYDSVLSWLDLIVEEILLLKTREANDRHGLILSLSSLISGFSKECSHRNIVVEIKRIPTYFRDSINPQFSNLIDSTAPYIETNREESPFLYFARAALVKVHSVLALVQSKKSDYRNPKLTAEAVCTLLISTYPLIKLNCIFQEFEKVRARVIDEAEFDFDLLYLVKALDVDYSSSTRNACTDEKQYSAMQAAYDNSNAPPEPLLVLIKKLLDEFLKSVDTETVNVVSSAAADYSVLCGQNIKKWFLEWHKYAFLQPGSTRKEMVVGYIYTMLAFPCELYEQWALACNTPEPYTLTSNIVQKWQSGISLETRIAIMERLSTSCAIRQDSRSYIQLIESGLDNYTTTSQGDVGSLLRIKSLEVVTLIWKYSYLFEGLSILKSTLEPLVPRVLRLAAEKLDRVRTAAKATLMQILDFSEPDQAQQDNKTVIESLSVSSKEYFQWLLEYVPEYSLGFDGKISHQENLAMFFSGYITSMTNGSEEVVRASRAALFNVCRVPEKPYPETETSNRIPSLVMISSQSHSRPRLKSGLVLKCITQVVIAGPERLFIPALETLVFLLDMDLCHEASIITSKHVWIQIIKKMRSSANVGKLETFVKFLGAITAADTNLPASERSEAVWALMDLIARSFPRIRILAADELFVQTGVGKGIDCLDANSNASSNLNRIHTALLDLGWVGRGR